MVVYDSIISVVRKLLLNKICFLFLGKKIFNQKSFVKPLGKGNCDYICINLKVKSISIQKIKAEQSTLLMQRFHC